MGWLWCEWRSRITEKIHAPHEHCSTCLDLRCRLDNHQFLRPGFFDRFGLCFCRLQSHGRYRGRRHTCHSWIYRPLNLKERYTLVLERLARAAENAGRKASDIHLIVVSKTHPVSLVDELAALGQVDFGENRIAELADKQATAAPATIRWHLIGQLQTNKVKLLTADVLLHTLDRISLAEKLQRQFSASGEKIRCLIQVNCSLEPNKSGVAPAEFDALCDSVAAMSAIQVMGLMTIAENSEDEKIVRGAFALLRQLSEKAHSRGIFSDYEGILSMGMSGDFDLAIAEGATHVRIGSAIFGSR